MSTVIFGLLTIVAGLVFCFRGYLAFTIVIPVWGAFVGFATGAGLVAALAGDSFLATAAGWIVGVLLAFVFAWLAYLYYAVAVTLVMASVGFAVGSALMVALGIDWTWLIVLVGVISGAALAFAAIVADLPMMLLVVLSAVGGAAAIVLGLMLLTGAIDAADLNTYATLDEAADDWWWYLIYVALAVLGILAQLSDKARRRATLRDAWAHGTT